MLFVLYVIYRDYVLFFMKIQLRDYQEENLAEIRSCIKRGYRRVVYRAPTGAGKSAIATFIADGTALSGKSLFFIVHRRNLLKQISDMFDYNGVLHGLIAPNYPETSNPIQVCSIGTILSRLKKGRVYKPDVIIVDEFHHAASKTFKHVIASITDHKTITIGLTATPERPDGKGLSDVADVIVHAPETRELIDDGYLCDFVHYFPEQIVDVSSVPKAMGDYQKKQLRDIIDNPAIVGDLVKTYRKYAAGKSAVYFALDINHSKNIADEFNKAGIPASHIDGTDHSSADEAIRKFKAREIQVIVNCSLVGEGSDFPFAEVCGMAVPTMSLVNYLQWVGRVLRIDPERPDKVAVIIDHVGNYHRHKKIDMVREWSLQGKKKRKGAERDYVPPVRQCPVAGCWTVHTPRPTCPSCGHVYEVIDRTPEQIEGELVAVARQEAAEKYDKKRQEWDCRSLEDFERLAVQRNYKLGWASHRWSVSKYNPERSVMA